MIIGIIGMLLIVVSWIPEILETIKNKGKGINPAFLAILTAGNVCLLIYSIQIGDLLFITLNSVLLCTTLVEGGIEVHFMLQKKKRPTQAHLSKQER